MHTDYLKPWYHGSQHVLTVLRAGSSITQNYELARAFSHRPSLVSISDDRRIKHDGIDRGFLYRVAEEVGPDDIYPHPQTGNWQHHEWVTAREVKVELLGAPEITESERLTELEVAEMRSNQQAIGDSILNDGPKIAYPL